MGCTVRAVTDTEYIEVTAIMCAVGPDNPPEKRKGEGDIKSSSSSFPQHVTTPRARDKTGAKNHSRAPMAARSPKNITSFLFFFGHVRTYSLLLLRSHIIIIPLINAWWWWWPSRSPRQTAAVLSTTEEEEEEEEEGQGTIPLVSSSFCPYLSPSPFPLPSKNTDKPGAETVLLLRRREYETVVHTLAPLSAAGCPPSPPRSKRGRKRGREGALCVHLRFLPFGPPLSPSLPPTIFSEAAIQRKK